MTDNSDNRPSSQPYRPSATVHFNALSHHPTATYFAGLVATILLSSTLFLTWAYASTDSKDETSQAHVTLASATAAATGKSSGSSSSDADGSSNTSMVRSGETKAAPKTVSNPDGETDDSGHVRTALTPAEEKAQCLDIVAHAVRDHNRQRLQEYCSHTSRLPACVSVENRPIAHLDSLSNSPKGKRVLVIGLIHGDENLAGEMTLEWAERLLKIPHRNSWRVVGLLNPDGLYRHTRMNAHGVDLNRNFPTKDWPDEAQKYWAASAKSDPRRFPGEAAASEPETKCAVAQIKDFKPDFIISIHTPYHVLDFDGPKLHFPAYRDLPWRALGNYPGSLGRFMWKDFSVPVLTVELGQKMVDAAQLQDIVGGLAIEASNKSGEKSVSTYETL